MASTLLMASIVLSPIAKQIITRLSSAAVKEVGLLWGVEKELSQLEETISTIQAVLLDAEEKQNHNHQVQNWLMRLQEVVLDADDLVDKFHTEAALHQLGMLGSEATNKVRAFFSKPKRLVFRRRFGNRIKAVKERLDSIRDDRQFLLDVRHEKIRKREDSHSYVPAELVIGRDPDKMVIMEFLMDVQIEENVGVVPIIGAGGMGKTTLAQLVYNDEKVEKHFDLRMWVCVSDDFNVKMLVGKILKSAATDKFLEHMEMDLLQIELRKQINGKRYLLVLDDVWNEDPQQWLNLKILLSNCAKGSRIIVTTRSARVGVIMSTIKPYLLGRLDKDKAWCLFEKVAFNYGQAPNNSEVVEIGMQIVEKCGGVPLALKTIGRTLYFKNPETEWSSFLTIELSRIPDQKEDDILPTLKLSYDHLPPHLKQCFAFCKLYAKDYEMFVDELIFFWVALGYVKQSTNSTQSSMDVGYEHIGDLLWGSFFQEFREDEHFFKKCKMHDLMHDLAKEVGSEEPIFRPPNKKCTFEKNTLQISKKSFQKRKIRTVICKPLTSSQVGRGQLACDGLISTFKSVRILDLRQMGIKAVPKSIGKLRHLRYLNLSGNKDIKALPDSITMLYNLQTLRLSGCEKLEELPKDIKKLVNLVNLEAYGCDSLTHMPSGLDCFTNLHLLSTFVLKKGKGCDDLEVGHLRDLMELNNLRGFMTIHNLGYEKNTKSANLKAKVRLSLLSLSWQSNVEDDMEYEETLEGLQPHPNLKGLELLNYHGVGLSSWFPSLTNLMNLQMMKCRKCRYLPQITQFHSLKQLYLAELDSLEYISNEDTFSSSSALVLPSLKEIRLVKLPNLKGWWRKEVDNSSALVIYNNFLPCLSNFDVLECPKLIFLPLSPNIETLSVQNNTWQHFRQALENTIRQEPSSSSNISINPFSNLILLYLYEVEELQCLLECLKNLTSLITLVVSECCNLKSLSPAISYLAPSLQNLLINGCPQLESSIVDAPTWLAMKTCLRRLHLKNLPQLETLPLGLQHVASLQQLEVRRCEKLIEIPEWISNFKFLHTFTIRECHNLTSLPQGIRQLTSLQTLEIEDCPALYRRCQRETGEDWSKVAHIPRLILTSNSNSHDDSSGAHTWKNSRTWWNLRHCKR